MHPGIVAHEQSALGIDPLRSPAPLTVGLHDVDLLIQRDALPGVSGVQAAPVRITGRLHEPCPPTVQIRHHHAASIRSGSGSPPACATLTASGSGLAPAKRRFRPIPTMALASSRTDRIPASLPTPATTSLGHLTPTSFTPAARTASATATPASNGIQPHAWTVAGTSRRTEKVNPSPGRLIHERSRRPRPAVCSSATSNCPWPATPTRSAFVDPVRSTTCGIGQPIRAQTSVTAVYRSLFTLLPYKS